MKFIVNHSLKFFTGHFIWVLLISLIVMQSSFSWATVSNLGLLSTTNENSPKTLKDAYLASIIRSETIGVQKELLAQADEVNGQAKGALFPTISGSATFLNQAEPSSVTGSAISPASQNTIQLKAAQPLFKGFSDFALLRQKKDLVNAQVFALHAAAQQLFYDLSTAYYNILGYQDDVKNYQIEIEINRKRLKELQSFFKIGRSQLTDLLTFEANIASLEVQLENSKGQLEVAKEVLAYLTGWNRNTILKDNEPMSSSAGDVTSFLPKVEQRPDVQTALATAQAQEEGVPFAFGSELPSVNLVGDYYLLRPPGALSDVNWDFSLQLSVPIFQGGVLQSQVRQAQSVARQYSLLLSQTRRTAEKEVRTFFDTLVADQKQMLKLGELVHISKKNYETEIQYYRNGLVTNLDVFQAIATYQDAQRQLDHQRETVKLDSAKLQAATGERPEIMTAVKMSHKP